MSLKNPVSSAALMQHLHQNHFSEFVYIREALSGEIEGCYFDGHAFAAFDGEGQAVLLLRDADVEQLIAFANEEGYIPQRLN